MNVLNAPPTTQRRRRPEKNIPPRTRPRVLARRRSEWAVGMAGPWCSSWVASRSCRESRREDSPRRDRPVSRLHSAPGVVVPVVDAEREANRPVVGWGVARHHPGRKSEERARLAPILTISRCRRIATARLVNLVVAPATGPRCARGPLPFPSHASMA